MKEIIICDPDTVTLKELEDLYEQGYDSVIKGTKDIFISMREL